jgi:hypothetical protein
MPFSVRWTAGAFAILVVPFALTARTVLRTIFRTAFISESICDRDRAPNVIDPESLL